MLLFSEFSAPEEDPAPDDKNLVSKHELTQDDALKNLYSEYEKGIVKKRKMLGHKIMPATASGLSSPTVCFIQHVPVQHD